jgi:hypothetical protein
MTTTSDFKTHPHRDMHRKIRKRSQAEKTYTPDPNAEESPQVYYTHKASEPRLLFYGEEIRQVQLPAGTRVIYPRSPMKALPDYRKAIRHALYNPLDMAPLPELLRPGMKVTIAIDDISLPTPAMVTPDIRQYLLEETLKILDDHHVDDVHIIVAIAFHRRMTGMEIKRMTGEEIFERFWPDQLYNHDAEDKDNMVEIGKTEFGEEVELNRRAVESDLIIYLNLNMVPMNGGHKSVGTGLCGYKSLRHHHDPEIIANCSSYMDPDHSELAYANTRIGKIIDEKLNVFHVETSINNRIFPATASFLGKNEDMFSTADRTAARLMMSSMKRLRPKAQRWLYNRMPAPYELTAVHAGATEPVHNRIIEAGWRQYSVDIKGQADVLVMGIPFTSPYSINSILNPLLVQVMALGYLYNMFRGGHPLLKNGGSLIVFHPMRDEWHSGHHPSYIEFFNRILPETTDSMKLQHKYEEEFAFNPEYIKMYREGYAYHGVHPFYMWYWGENGRRNMGQVIAVDPVDDHVPQRMGWQVARNLDQALGMARELHGPDPQITMMHSPPISIAHMV